MPKSKPDAPQRAVERAFPFDPIRLGRLIPVASEFLGADISRARKVGRGIGKRCGWIAYVGFYFRTADGRLVPSRFGKVVPSADATLLPLIARMCLDAAAAAHQHGILKPEHWERANLEPPTDA